MDVHLIDVKHFCVKYACGKTKAYELIAAGALDAVKLGGRTRIVAASAERWAATLPKFSPGKNVVCDEAGQ